MLLFGSQINLYNVSLAHARFSTNQSMDIAYVTMNFRAFFLSTNYLKPRECIKQRVLGTCKIRSRWTQKFKGDEKNHGYARRGTVPDKWGKSKSWRGKVKSWKMCWSTWERTNAPDHWLAVQQILHLETTEQPKNLLWDDDLFADVMVNTDCDDSKFAGEIQISYDLHD